MTKQTIDNGVDLGDVILWQYQNAEKLKAMVQYYATFFNVNVEQFHDDWREKIFNIEASGDSTLDSFSLALWGAVLGYSRPTYKNASGVETPVSDKTYRKLLKARFRVMRSNASLTAIVQYLRDAFDANVLVNDTADMALHYSLKVPNSLDSDVKDEVTAVIQQNPDSVFVYPAGVKTNDRVDEIVFGFEGQNTGKSSGQPDVGGFDESTFANAWSTVPPDYDML